MAAPLKRGRPFHSNRSQEQELGSRGFVFSPFLLANKFPSPHAYIQPNKKGEDEKKSRICSKGKNAHALEFEKTQI